MVVPFQEFTYFKHEMDGSLDSVNNPNYYRNGDGEVGEYLDEF